MYMCKSLIKKTFMFIIIYFKNRISNIVFALQSSNDINIF